VFNDLYFNLGTFKKSLSLVDNSVKLWTIYCWSGFV